ncbi:MAG: phosphoheptose isomerase [Planctomycetota bacterium]|nr:MAG: phosphoheptose isomerase [Planctomycetota bacterium]
MSASAEPSGMAVAAAHVAAHLLRGAEVQRALAEDGARCAALAAIARVLAGALAAGRKVLLCGNGGSAADAQHVATELVVRLSARRERRALAALALTTDTSLLTACANDYGFERVFARQVEALGQPGDVLIGISTSGNSPNVVLAFEEARRRGLVTVLFSGGEGGRLRALADHAFLVPAAATSTIQEVHLAAYHAMCELVEVMLFGEAVEEGRHVRGR